MPKAQVTSNPQCFRIQIESKNNFEILPMDTRLLSEVNQILEIYKKSEDTTILADAITLVLRHSVKSMDSLPLEFNGNGIFQTISKDSFSSLLLNTTIDTQAKLYDACISLSKSEFSELKPGVKILAFPNNGETMQ